MRRSTTRRAASRWRASSGRGNVATFALRERTLGRLLYETAARADEVLRLNVEDLDVAGKRARTRSKGGDTDWLFFGSAIALVSGAAPHLRALRRQLDRADCRRWTTASHGSDRRDLAFGA